MKGRRIRLDDIITLNHPSNDQFIIFLSHKRKDKGFFNTGLKKFANFFSDYLINEIISKSKKQFRGNVRIFVGHSIIIYNPFINTEQLIDTLIENAKIMKDYQKFCVITENKEKVQELIYKESISTVYQPIIDVNSLKVIGYEALTRGPKDSIYENPLALFKAAGEVDLIIELDRICKKHAFLNAKTLPKKTKIFVNCIPSSLADPDFKGKEMDELLKMIKLKPSNVVLEITERETIDNYKQFKEILVFYTKLGFAIAVDDAGAGYSNFEALLELKPNYVKIDISLIHNIDKDILKQQITQALVNICKTIKADVIAEGIETDKEFNMVKNLGVTHAQGYLFAFPEFPFPKVNPKYCQKK